MTHKNTLPICPTLIPNILITLNKMFVHFSSFYRTVYDVCTNNVQSIDNTMANYFIILINFKKKIHYILIGLNLVFSCSFFKVPIKVISYMGTEKNIV